MRRAIFLCLPLLAPPALAVECSTIAGNLVTNCGFSSGTTGWTPLGFTGFTTIGAAGENGTTAGHIDSSQDFFAAIQSSCIPVSPGASFDMGYAAKRSTPGGLEVRCIVSCQEFFYAG